MTIVRTFLLVLVAGLWCGAVFAQTFPVADNFSYTSGSNLNGQGSWSTSQVGDSAVIISSIGLKYQGYPGDGVGRAAFLGRSREAIGLLFTQQSGAGTVVYYSMMLLIDSSSTAGSRVANLATTSGSNSSERWAVLYVKDNGTGWRLGVQKRTGGVAPVYHTSDLAKTDTHVVVIKYEFYSGALNDSLKMWVNPNLGGTEPAPDVKLYDPLISDSDNFEFLELNERTSGGVGDSTRLYVDGVRVAGSWSNAPLPVQMVEFIASANATGVDLRWSTATEVNNFGFEIERRQILSTEAAPWTVVGFVQGGGTSTEPRSYRFTDYDVDYGRYAYRIKQIDLNGATTYYSATEVMVGIVPDALALEPNYPNPFNPSTNVSFSVPEDGYATLKIFDMLGQEVATLFDGEAIAGRLYKKTFDASALPTGVYISRLEFGGKSLMRKMLFVK